jgi:hypothetical protein
VGSGGFFITPVIACLFFVASVVYVGDAKKKLVTTINHEFMDLHRL